MENQNKPHTEQSNQGQDIRKADKESQKSEERKAPGHQEAENKAGSQQKLDKDSSKAQD